MEIANELLPKIVRAVSDNTTDREQLNLLYDPAVYGNILRFYDGICEWEEGSSTPVLHVGWAQHLTFSLNKFDPRTRAKIDVGKDEDDSDDDSDKGDEKDGDDVDVKISSSKENTEEIFNRDSETNPLKLLEEIKEIDDKDSPSTNTNIHGQKVTARGRKGQKRKINTSMNELDCKIAPYSNKKQNIDENSNTEDKIKSTIEELASKVGKEETAYTSPPNPSITALAQQCSLNILNKDYLLGAGEPFSSSAVVTAAAESLASSTVTMATGTDALDEFLSSKSNGSAFIGLTMDSMLKAESPADMMLSIKRADNITKAVPATSPSTSPTSDILASFHPVQVELRSEKMKGLKMMFKCPKLNASAIKLQLTAQSQVHVKDSRFLDFCEPSGSVRKRPRREIV